MKFLNNNGIEEYPDYEKDYEAVGEELKKIKKEQGYPTKYIRKVLSSKVELRKTFSAVIINNPARKQEIKEYTFISNKSIYNHLYKLKELGLINMISIMDLWNRSNLNIEENKIISKFNFWVANMSDSQRQNFAARTKYYVLSEVGKRKEIVNLVLQLEKNELDGENENY